MLKALNSGASALSAQQIKVDTIANNLANVNTSGFKKGRSEFAELVGQQLGQSGLPVAGSAAGNRSGSGVRVERVAKIFEPGSMIDTGRPLDLAIQGEGFFQVQTEGGEEGYTRDGSFYADRDGSLVTAAGCKLEGVTLPPSAEKITVTHDGRVQAEVAGSVTEAGQITLYRFANPAGLSAAGRNIFRHNPAAGEIFSGIPGSEGLGTTRQGSLELSNVDLVEEMTSLIEAQRAYGFGARAVRTADELWGMANNMRK